MNRTALLVIDMQNSFLHPDGENFYPDAPEVIAPALRLIEAADKAGAIIVHVSEGHRAGFEDFEQRRLPMHCLSGAFNAQFYAGFGPAGRAREITIVKRRYSAFFGTDLALFLTEQKIDRVVLCGVKTNVCVRATATDAFGHGFEVVLAREATNSNRRNLADASIEDIDRYVGKAVDMDTALGLLA